MGGVSALDQYPGAVNVLMLKKAMETEKAAFAALTEAMAQASPTPPARTAASAPHPDKLGSVVDVRL